MAKYEMQASNLPQKEGDSTVYFPRMRIAGHLSTDELVRQAVQYTTYNPAEARAVLDMVFRHLGQCMARGYSISLDGFGSFSLSLRLKKGRKRETGAEGEQRRNAQSIEVGGVNFKPDKRWLREMNCTCRLERSERKFERSSTRYTEAERLALAREFLQTHEEMALWQYCALTGLLKNKASRELRRWEAQPEVTGIRGVGKKAMKRWRSLTPQPPLP